MDEELPETELHSHLNDAASAAQIIRSISDWLTTVEWRGKITPRFTVID
jgi:hypothetical protein